MAMAPATCRTLRATDQTSRRMRSVALGLCFLTSTAYAPEKQRMQKGHSTEPAALGNTMKALFQRRPHQATTGLDPVVLFSFSLYSIVGPLDLQHVDSAERGGHPTTLPLTLQLTLPAKEGLGVELPSRLWHILSYPSLPHLHTLHSSEVPIVAVHTQEAQVTGLLSAGPLTPGKDVPGKHSQGDTQEAVGFRAADQGSLQSPPQTI
uniref:uncharacterized protein LOC110597419 n=1 Tax=Ictidomys tridecemlineatus TaxID=43179 RepID=UPI001A9E5318|nr:uncharacterized protein LOC110597419 [Ictidomys tridecemlineatus]